MTISSLGGCCNHGLAQVNAGGPVKSTAQVSGVGRNSEGGYENRGGVKGAAHPHGGGVFMQSVMQALSSMGIAPEPSASGTPQTGETDRDGDHDGSGVATASQDPRHALHTFMHDLFQAMRQSGQAPSNGDGDQVSLKGIGSASAASVPSRYASAEDGVQRLISEMNASSGVGSSAGSTGNDALSTLQKDFQNLVAASGKAASQSGTGDSAGDKANSAANPSLLSFLQQLETNLQKNESLFQRPSLGLHATA